MIYLCVSDTQYKKYVLSATINKVHNIYKLILKKYIKTGILYNYQFCKVIY